jgi:class 3 adenylate cyclase
VLVSRSFAFVDLCGFTAFTEERGVQETVRVLADFRTCLRQTASRRSVRVAKWLGDGAMIVAVEPGLLVEWLLEIEHDFAASSLPLQVSAGATIGSAILFEGDDYISSSINLAAHLCQAAKGGEVLLAVELREFLPPWAEVVERSDRQVAGFVQPVPVLRVGVARPGPGDQAVTDPVCRLVLPSQACRHRRQSGDGPVWFCSDACLSTWESETVPAS